MHTLEKRKNTQISNLNSNLKNLKKKKVEKGNPKEAEGSHAKTRKKIIKTGAEINEI